MICVLCLRSIYREDHVADIGFGPTHDGCAADFEMDQWEASDVQEGRIE
ncbi:MAG TPA: hypothetical protein VJP78_06520 [Thermoleophilia bacterium]|nr:hypothetical protein [Thermoleophilia bacterium]